MDGIPLGDKTILVSPFAASVQRNQFGATSKSKLLHVTVKAAVSDVSASFRTHLWGDLILDESGQRSLILQKHLRGYNSVDLPTKHQNSISAKLVFHIYKKQHSHLSTAIVQLISGAFFLCIQSCEYSKTPMRGNKRTRILWKGGIMLYRKQRKLLHGIDCIHLVYKVSPTFRTQKNGVKNATVTQWRTGKHIFMVWFWADIITRLKSYPVSSCEIPVNTVWVENLKTTITSQMATKYLRSGTLSFVE